MCVFVHVAEAEAEAEDGENHAETSCCMSN